MGWVVAFSSGDQSTLFYLNDSQTEVFFTRKIAYSEESVSGNNIQKWLILFKRPTTVVSYNSKLQSTL